MKLTQRDNEEYFEFLDRLRESGVTNMFGAGPYLRVEYPWLNGAQARAILAEWMETFDQRHPQD